MTSVEHDARVFARWRVSKGFSDWTHVSAHGVVLNAESEEDGYQSFASAYIQALGDGYVPSVGERIHDSWEVPLMVDIDLSGNGGMPREHVLPYAFVVSAVDAFRRAFTSLFPADMPRDSVQRMIDRVLVMQRPHPTPSKKEGQWKSGFHIFFPDALLTRAERTVIRNLVVQDAAFDQSIQALPPRFLTRSSETIVDDCYCRRSANWQMYGSSKPGVPPYLATWWVDGHVWTPVPQSTEPSACGVSGSKRWDVWVPLTRVWCLPVPPHYRPMPEMTDEARAAIVAAEGMPIVSAMPQTASVLHGADPEQMRTARACMAVLAAWRSENYDAWFKVACALRWTSADLWGEWLAFSRRCPEKFSAQACEKRWNEAAIFVSSGRSRPVTLGSLVAWARADIRTAGGDDRQWWSSIRQKPRDDLRSSHGIVVNELDGGCATFDLTEMYRLDRVDAADAKARCDIIYNSMRVDDADLPEHLRGQEIGRRVVKYHFSVHMGRATNRPRACFPGAYQRLSSDVISSLADGLYSSVVAESQTTSILRATARRLGVDTPKLDMYARDPDSVAAELLSDLGVSDHRFAHLAVSDALNGNVDAADKLPCSEWLREAACEVLQIAGALRPEASCGATQREAVRARQMAHLRLHLASIEFRIVQTVADVCEMHGWELAAILARVPAFLVRAKSGKQASADVSSIRRYLTSGVERACGAKIVFRIGGVSSIVDVAGNLVPPPPRSASNDTDAAGIVVDEVGWRLKRCGDIYFVLDSAHVWRPLTRHEALLAISDIVPDVAMTFPLLDQRLRDNYHRNARGARAIADRVVASIVNIPDLKSRMASGSAGKLFYRSGHWNFFEGRFCSREAVDSMTQVRIPFDLPTRPCEKVFEEFERRILRAIFPRADVRRAFLQGASRCMAACVGDKLLFMFVGNRNCGKSVITRLFMNAFPGYVGTFNASSLLRRKGASGAGASVDEDRALSFLNQFETTRLMITNEIRATPGSVLDGELIKMITSGRDKLRTRKLFRESEEISPQATMFVSANDPPPIEPPDARKFLVRFEGETEFVDEITDDMRARMSDGRGHFLPCDPDIDAYIASEDAIAAFTWRIIDAWQPTKPAYPESILGARDQVDSVESVLADVVEPYDGGFVPSRDLQTALSSRGIKLGGDKLAFLMRREFKVESSKCRVDGRQIRGFRAVRLRDPEEEMA